jgi:methionyl-tRNA synthetase
VEAPRAVQIAGKDNLRQQSAMWQAMLMAANLPTSRQVFINGFISVDGQKMSKSLGNVISPNELIARYGVDGTRYLLLTKSTFGEDSDISWDKMDAIYNSELANGLGNLTARIITLSGDAGDAGDTEDIDKDIAQNEQDVEFEKQLERLQDKIAQNVRKMEMRGALSDIWQIVGDANKYIEETKPWELRKNDTEKFAQIMRKLLDDLQLIAKALTPFLPETSQKIIDALESRQRIILFERI